MTDSLWQHILQWLEQLWAAVTGCLPGQSNPNQVLPPALSKVRTTRPGRPQSAGHNAGLDSVIWQAQRGQFLRHPSLRSKPSGYDELYQLPPIAYLETEKTQTPDRLAGFKPNFASAPSPGYTVSDWSHIERIASTLHPARALLPPRPSVPSVVITPSTPSGGSGSEDNTSADLPAPRPIGSGSGGGVKSLSHPADVAFLQRSNQTTQLEDPVSRHVRNNFAFSDSVRTNRRTSATTNTTRRSLTQVPRLAARSRGQLRCSVLRDLEKGLVTSFSDLDSPPLSPASPFRPDSSSTPRLPFRMSWSHAPSGPASSHSPPQTPTHCRATFPAWDMHIWGDPTSIVADRAFFDDPSYYTSTPPCKKRADGIFGVQRIREDYNDTPPRTFRSSSISTCSTPTPPPPATPPAIGTMNSHPSEESEYVPYTDVFDLDMYHLDSFRSSIIIETSYLPHRPSPEPPINPFPKCDAPNGPHGNITPEAGLQQTHRLSTNSASQMPSPDASSRESVPLALLIAAHYAKTSSKPLEKPIPRGASETNDPVNAVHGPERAKRFAFVPVPSPSPSSGPGPGPNPTPTQAPESPALSLSASSEGVHVDYGIKRYRDHYRPPHYSKPPRLCAGDPHSGSGSGSLNSSSPKSVASGSGSGSGTRSPPAGSSPEVSVVEEGRSGSIVEGELGGAKAGVGVAGAHGMLTGQRFGISMRGPVQSSPGSVAETDDSEHEIENGNAGDNENGNGHVSHPASSSSVSDPDDTLLFIQSAYGMSPPHRHHRNRSISPHSYPHPHPHQQESRKNQSLSPPEHKPRAVRKFSVRNRGTDESSASGATSTTVPTNSSLSARGRSGCGSGGPTTMIMHDAGGGSLGYDGPGHYLRRERDLSVDMDQSTPPIIQIPAPPLPPPLPPAPAIVTSSTTGTVPNYPRGPRRPPHQAQAQPRLRERERERPIVPVVIVSRYSAATDSPSSFQIDNPSHGVDAEDGLTVVGARARSGPGPASGSGAGSSRIRPLVSLIPERGSVSASSRIDAPRSAGGTSRGQGGGGRGGRAFPVRPLIDLNSSQPTSPQPQRFGVGPRPLITLIPGSGPSGPSSQAIWNQSRALSLATYRNHGPFNEAVGHGGGSGGRSIKVSGPAVPVPTSSSVEALKARLKETCDNFERSIYALDDHTGATSPSASCLWEPIPF